MKRRAGERANKRMKGKEGHGKGKWGGGRGEDRGKINLILVCYFNLQLNFEITCN